jgi:hypothetical protein
MVSKEATEARQSLEVLENPFVHFYLHKTPISLP